MKKLLTSLIFPTIIVFFSALLLAANFQKNTFLLGWDNIMPEFNLGLNLERSLFAIWQEYRGLGLADGLSHSANLMHTIYIWLLSFILPQNPLRYFFIISAHLAGGLGFFYLARHLTKSTKASFLGAIFYMFNLGVIQIFFAPLETFAMHFAALPLITLALVKAFEKTNRKNMLILFFVLLLTSPQFFVPTFFLVILTLVVSLASHFIYQTRSRIMQKRKIFAVVALFILVNLFWLLPYAYNLKNSSKQVKNARINQFSSEEIYYRNLARGDVLNVLSLKGFMMDAVEYDTHENKNVLLLDIWKKHSDNILYQSASFLMLAIVGYGFFASRKKLSEVRPFIFPAAIAFFFLANNTPGMAEGNWLFRNLFPPLAEAFRFPFTKFILLFSFCISIFLSFGFKALFRRKKYLNLIFISLFIILIYQASPAFNGNFFSPLLKVKIPTDYFEMTSYLNTKPEERRIALLPTYTFWNWQYRSWGQRGSDFIWHGIKQPILMRPFDPWSGPNEQFFNELSTSIDRESVSLFQNVLDKYDIDYLLLDQTLMTTLSTKPINYAKLIRFLEKSKVVTLEKNAGALLLYKTNKNKSWVYRLDGVKTPQVSPSFSNSEIDMQYADLGNYIVSKRADYIYPYASFFTGKLQDSLEFNVEESKESLIFSPKKKLTAAGSYILETPSLFAGERFIPARFKIENNNLLISPVYPKILVGQSEYELKDNPFSFNLKGTGRPEKITLSLENQTLKNGGVGFLENNSVNFIKVDFANLTEIIPLDLTFVDKQKETFSVPISGNLNDLKLIYPKLKTASTYENIIKMRKYTINIPPLDFRTEFKCADSRASTYRRPERIEFTALCESAEITSYLDNLYHSFSYLIAIDSKHISGLPLTFYADNIQEKRSEVEGRLSKTAEKSYMVLPKTQDYFKGYGIHIVAKSLGREIHKSEVVDLSVYPVPFETLSKIRLVRLGQKTEHVEKKPLEFKRINNFIYQVKNPGAGIIVLSQAYNTGWMAFGDGVGEHMLVNNWANGWQIKMKNSNEVFIIFLPQILEFVGFGILGITLVWILRKDK